MQDPCGLPPTGAPLSAGAPSQESRTDAHTAHRSAAEADTKSDTAALPDPQRVIELLAYLDSLRSAALWGDVDAEGGAGDYLPGRGHFVVPFPDHAAATVRALVLAAGAADRLRGAAELLADAVGDELPHGCKAMRACVADVRVALTGAAAGAADRRQMDARECGRSGGLARAAKLTPERRREIGRLAAVARWSKRP
jgi:hypothetical protein